MGRMTEPGQRLLPTLQFVQPADHWIFGGQQIQIDLGLTIVLPHHFLCIQGAIV